MVIGFLSREEYSSTRFKEVSRRIEKRIVEAQNEIWMSLRCHCASVY